MATKKFVISAIFTGDASDLISVTKRLGQNLKTTGDLFSQFATQATVAMAAVNAAFLGSTIKAAQLGDQFAKTAFRLDVSVSALRELSFVAEQSGADLNSLQTAFRRLSSNVVDAASGLEEAKRNFEAVDVSIRDSKGNIKSQSVLFKEVAVSLGNMKNATLRQGLALKLMGRSGDGLAVMFDNMARAGDAYARQLELINAGLDDQTAKISEEVVDALNLWKKSIEGVGFAMVRALGPALEQALIWLSALVSVVSRFIDRNKPMIISIAKLAVGVGVVVSAFALWARTLAAFGSAISALATFVAGPAAFSVGVLGVLMGGMALLTLQMAKASDIARFAVGGLIGAISIAGITAGIASGNIRLLAASFIGLAGSASVLFLSPKLAELIDELNLVFEELQFQIERTQQEFIKAGKGGNIFGDEISELEKRLRKLRAAAVAPGFNEFTDAFTKAFSAGGFDLSIAGEFLGAIIREMEGKAIDNIDSARALISSAMENLFESLGGGGPGGQFGGNKFSEGEFGIVVKAGDKIAVMAEGIKRAFGGIGSAENIAAIQEFGFAMESISPDLAEAARHAINLDNKLQAVANVALAQFGDIGVRAAESVTASFLELGNAVGGVVQRVIGGVTEMERLTKTLKIEKLEFRLAETVEEQDKWTAAAEATQRELLKLERAALDNTASWDKFFQSMRQWVAKLIADITALIIKMAILKALSSFGPFSFLGGLFGGLGGGSVGGGGGSGGIDTADIFTDPVTGRISGTNSPTSFIPPSLEVESSIGSIVTPIPISVHIRAGLLAGDEGTARELARMVQEKIRFIETGQTL